MKLAARLQSCERSYVELLCIAIWPRSVHSGVDSPGAALPACSHRFLWLQREEGKGFGGISGTSSAGGKEWKRRASAAAPAAIAAVAMAACKHGRVGVALAAARQVCRWWWRWWRGRPWWGREVAALWKSLRHLPHECQHKGWHIVVYFRNFKIIKKLKNSIRQLHSL